MSRELNEELIEEIRCDIEDADKVLIGIGYEWNAIIEENQEYFVQLKNIEDLVAGKDIKIDEKQRGEYIAAYKRLKELVADKDYYVISLAYDDLIYNVFSEENNVVTPCGGYRLLQCGQHIMTRDEAVINDGKPVCPICGGKLSHNNIMNEHYMEESYLPKFEEYKGWLQSTINKKIVILELGADMRFPQVIRFAFDRLVKFNLKSKMYRVNKSICMVDSSAEGRGVAVNCDSMELVRRML